MVRVGLYLTDLVMVDEVHKKRVAHPEYPDTQLINVERLARIAQIHSDVKTYQVVRYCLKVGVGRQSESERERERA